MTARSQGDQLAVRGEATEPAATFPGPSGNGLSSQDPTSQNRRRSPAVAIRRPSGLKWIEEAPGGNSFSRRPVSERQSFISWEVCPLVVTQLPSGLTSTKRTSLCWVSRIGSPGRSRCQTVAAGLSALRDDHAVEARGERVGFPAHRRAQIASGGPYRQTPGDAGSRGRPAIALGPWTSNSPDSSNRTMLTPPGHA